MKRATLDGGVHCWKGTATGAPPLVIAPAMGVPASFYFPLVSFLESDFDIAVVEYPGMDRPTESSADMVAWADDLGRVIDYMASDQPTALITHSVGGQLFGLLPQSNVHRVLMIASQSGYWKNWDGLGKLGMFMFWYAFVPSTTSLLKRIPMSMANAGDDIPQFVGKQWAEFGRSPDYIMGHARRSGRDNFLAYQGQLRSVGFTDDSYAPRRAVEQLFLAYANARKTLQFVEPKDLNTTHVGHFSAFRDRDNNRTLWDDWRRYLIDG